MKSANSHINIKLLKAGISGFLDSNFIQLLAPAGFNGLENINKAIVKRDDNRQFELFIPYLTLRCAIYIKTLAFEKIYANIHG